MSITGTEFDFVRSLVHRESAIVLEPGKEYLVEARLLPLARSVGLPDVSSYVGEVMRSGCPRRRLEVVEALTTNETSWFRDGSPFRALESDLIPAVVGSRVADRTLRVWSAACSSGQEAYSIAMVAAPLVSDAGWRLDITGTDISEEMLSRARAGRYSQLEVNRGLPAGQLVRWFERAGTEWQIADELRQVARFTRANLAAPLSVGGPFDVVFLRNVLIYLDTGTKRDILRRVASTMRPGGWLVLGAAETTLGIDPGWERCVVGRATAYRQIASNTEGR